MAKVFINPGHSKDCSPDPGATGHGYKEADIAAKIANALSTKLVAQGIDAVVYQQCKSNATANAQLNEVPKVANASKADLFLSIHLNAASATAKGTETLYAANSANGMKFAKLVNTELAKPFDIYTFVDRGAKQDTRNLLVLRATSMPAALTEIGFISNAEDINFIVKHINEIAQRLCNAICKYFNVQQKVAITGISTKCNEVKIQIDSDGLYNCYVDNTLKLKGNKFSSCLKWLDEHYS